MDRDEVKLLSTWTIYNSPSDYPGFFIARRFEIKAGDPYPTAEFRKSVLVDELRQGFIDQGLTVIPRHPTDPPSVVETWI